MPTEHFGCDLIEAATHAMLLSLDPYSDYLNGTAYKALKEDDGKFGVGD